MKYFKSVTAGEFQKYFIWFVVVFFVLLRIPSLVEPIWYADEGIYLVVSQALHDGRTLYSEIWDNKPPFLYFLYFLSGGLFGIKLLSLVFGIGEVFLFYKIAQKLFSRNLSIFVSTILFAFFLGTPFLEGNIANAENFMLLPILGCLYLLLRKGILSQKTGVYAGILFFTAIMIKIVAVFDLLVFILFAFSSSLKNKKSMADFKKGIIACCCALGLLSTVTVLVLLSQGIFSEFINAVFTRSFEYVSEKNSAGLSNSVLIIKTFILLGITGVIFYTRHKYSSQAFLIFTWVVFSLYNVYFSQRLFTHYLLLLVPSLLLLFGLIFEYKGRARMFVGGAFLLVVVTIFTTFTFYNRGIGYYKNYIDFIFLGKDVNSYHAFFDQATPRNYELANIIKTEMNGKKVLVWSDGGQVYAMADRNPIGRYIAAYHMIFYKNATDEARRMFQNEKPDIVIEITKVPKEFELIENYQELYRVEDARIYEREL